MSKNPAAVAQRIDQLREFVEVKLAICVGKEYEILPGGFHTTPHRGTVSPVLGVSKNSQGRADCLQAFGL